ncbi:MAG TPA: hypothetical protein VGH12_02760 [Steroidobacteraceae bacterium]
MQLLVPNALHHYTVNMDDLPLSCPMPEMMLWNSHPKVLGHRTFGLGEVLLLRRRVHAESQRDRACGHQVGG